MFQVFIFASRRFRIPFTSSRDEDCIGIVSLIIGCGSGCRLIFGDRNLPPCLGEINGTFRDKVI